MPPPPPPEGERLKSPPKPSTEEAYGTSRTTIFVSLPANAKLLIDGHATVSTSANRVFASPALEMGKDYYYTLEGELVRDGQIITASKTITFRAGQEVQVELEFPTTTVIER